AGGQRRGPVPVVQPSPGRRRGDRQPRLPGAQGLLAPPVADRVAAAAHLPGDPRPGRGPPARRPLPPSPAVALIAHLDQARGVSACLTISRRPDAPFVIRSAAPCTGADPRR